MTHEIIVGVGGEALENPIQQADRLLAEALTRRAELQVGYSPTMPRLGEIEIDDGTGKTYPLQVPLLGDGHIAIGNPGLREVVKPAPIGDIPKVQQEGAIKAAKALAESENKLNRGQFLAERTVAINIATNVITDAVESVPHDSLRITVYDPLGAGHAFSALSGLNKGGGERYTSVGPDGISQLLVDLEAQNVARSQALGQYDSMRDLVEHTNNRPPEPWHIVTIIGDGRTLDGPTQTRLDSVIRNGARCGVSVIVSGFDVFPQSGSITRLDVVASAAVISSTIPSHKVRLYQAPSRTEMYRATQLDLSVDATVPMPRPMRGPAYADMLARGTTGQANARQVMKLHARDFPILNRESLPEIGESAADYLEDLLEIANSPDPFAAAKEALHAAFDPKSSMNAAGRAQALATYRLILDAGYGRGFMPESTATKAFAQLRTYIHNLAGTVLVTRFYGREFLHRRMHAYLQDALLVSPPYWVTRLVADEGIPRGRMTAANAPAQQAITYCLERIFDPSQELKLNLSEKPQQALRAALVELLLLRLAQFDNPDLPTEYRTILARSAASRLGRITREQLPPIAHGIFDAYTEFVKPKSPPTEGLGSAATSDVVQQ